MKPPQRILAPYFYQVYEDLSPETLGKVYSRGRHPKQAGKVFPGNGKCSNKMLARGLSVLGFQHLPPEGEPARTFVKAFKSSNSAITVQGVRQVYPVAKMVGRMSWLYRGVVPGESQYVYVKFDAQYSSIRMLRGYGSQAVIDDIESLF
ncbi:hypothetical protein EV182_004667 [Spiromyces aspiralis]|uniref:Uncharacterized protein n=1 Tax=Spiromyces aspiralis TaxID=68401 RepID=A0ACC1HIJ8_9FUNG|nr:hypothetical protein EV182_004667 [Spiromyces aspiralis]